MVTQLYKRKNIQLYDPKRNKKKEKRKLRCCWPQIEPKTKIIKNPQKQINEPGPTIIRLPTSLSASLRLPLHILTVNDRSPTSHQVTKPLSVLPLKVKIKPFISDFNTHMLQLFNQLFYFIIYLLFFYSGETGIKQQQQQWQYHLRSWCHCFKSCCIWHYY